jgi:hypothetical protein
MVEQVPGLGLTLGEWADDWTSVLIWNWCPANGLINQCSGLELVPCE